MVATCEPEPGPAVTSLVNCVMPPEPVAESVVPVIVRDESSVISCGSPLPLSPRPSSFEAADTFCIFAYVTASFAIVAACEPEPGPAVTSLVNWVMPEPPEDGCCVEVSDGEPEVWT